MIAKVLHRPFATHASCIEIMLFRLGTFYCITVRALRSVYTIIELFIIIIMHVYGNVRQQMLDRVDTFANIREHHVLTFFNLKPLYMGVFDPGSL